MFTKKMGAALLSVMMMTSLTACSPKPKVKTTESADQSIDLTNFKVTIPQKTYVYDGKPKTPKVTVTSGDNDALKEGTDYRVTYSNNTKVGTADITIKGLKNYKGTLHQTFTIVKSLKKIDETALKNILNEMIAFDSGESGSSTKVVEAASDLLTYVAQINLAKADKKALTKAVTSWYTGLTKEQQATLDGNKDSILDTADGIIAHYKDYSDSLEDAGVLDQTKETLKVKHLKDDWKALKKLLEKVK